MMTRPEQFLSSVIDLSDPDWALKREDIVDLCAETFETWYTQMYAAGMVRVQWETITELGKESFGVGHGRLHAIGENGQDVGVWDEYVAVYEDPEVRATGIFKEREDAEAWVRSYFPDPT